MSWILLAVIGHLANAAAFIIDKTLLSSTWKTSATYAALIGSLSGVVVLASPWVKEWPGGMALIFSALFGGLFVLAIWAFFEALRRAEASRVVPIIGSLIPVFTLVGTTIFLGERINSFQAVGFLCLILATAVLAHGSKGGRLDRSVIGLAILSASLFAVSSVAGKYAFDHSSFLGVFVVSRGVAALTGITVGLLIAGARKELLSMTKKKSKQSAGTGSLGLVIVGQASGSLGFILVNAALAQGSAAFVNALQAVQYAAIVLVAWVGGARLQRLLQEDISRAMLLKKGFAIVLVGAGLWLLSL